MWWLAWFFQLDPLLCALPCGITTAAKEEMGQRNQAYSIARLDSIAKLGASLQSRSRRQFSACYGVALGLVLSMFAWNRSDLADGATSQIKPGVRFVPRALMERGNLKAPTTTVVVTFFFCRQRRILQFASRSKVLGRGIIVLPCERLIKSRSAGVPPGRVEQGTQSQRIESKYLGLG